MNSATPDDPQPPLVDFGRDNRIDSVTTGHIAGRDVIQADGNVTQVGGDQITYNYHSVSISQVFDAVGGELLILGAPGSGKTTMLLELTRDLLARARQDATHPLLVVFNLSSWAC